jgi:hypothetical protein
MFSWEQEALGCLVTLFMLNKVGLVEMAEPQGYLLVQLQSL